MVVTTMSVAKARSHFADLINRVAYAKERVILTRRDKGVVAVVPVEDVQLLEELEDRMDLAEARAALVDANTHGSVSWDRIKSDLGL